MEKSNMNEYISIVLICDDNYIIPTSVAITSMIDSKKQESKYRIYIVAASLSEDNENLFKTFAVKNVEINIIKENANRFQSLHTFDENAICVASVAALLKFVLPELLNEDKVLYLDGDILVKEDLSELFHNNIEDYLAGVIIDSGSIYYKHQYVEKVEHYFNSGVMLLNLKKFRDEDITSKLIQTKKNLTDSNLMDQNVFNIVLDGRIKCLPIRYNFLPVNLKRARKKWTIKDINETYNTNYESKKELFSDGAIIHFSSKDKPWKVSNVSFSSDWYKMYLKTGLDKKIERYTLGTQENAPEIKVSVIIPVYNVEKYLHTTLEEVLSQSLSEIEVICINDGSSDLSKSIIEEYQKKDNRIILIDKENAGQAIARNIGIRKAKGKYIYFLDSDDLITDNCLEKLYNCAEKKQLDLLLFDGTSFFENETLKEKHANYKTYYKRKNKYTGVYNGQKLYALMVDAGDYKVSPCLQFLRTEYVHEHNLYFPEGIIHEDNLFAYYALILAKRVMHIPNTLFYRRVRIGSTMTTNIGIKNFIGYYVSAYELMKFVNNNALTHDAEWRTNKQISGYLNKVYDIYNNHLSEDEKANYITDEKINLFYFEMLMSVYRQAASSPRLENQVRSLRKELNQQIDNNNRLENEIKKQQKNINDIKKSKTYRIGTVIVYIPKKIRNTFRYLKKNGFKQTIRKICH